MKLTSKVLGTLLSVFVLYGVISAIACFFLTPTACAALKIATLDALSPPTSMGVSGPTSPLTFVWFLATIAVSVMFIY
ncbi:MAG: hypothetical protein KKD18_04800 [Nanoarchaeota archaeon]|nr:hypothetical protein [Nanoarchaeota archaeon]MBU0977709.1 hypothetical protein [Nanoarchaeota archaeon]